MRNRTPDTPAVTDAPADAASDAASDAPAPPQFLIGIDLGTTNSAAAFARLGDATVQLRPVRQLVAPDEIADAAVLPSFLFFDLAQRQPVELGEPPVPGRPWIGTAAREQGRLRPGRLVASSKSWLCHPGVDRSAAILPWHGEPDCPRISPVEAAASILAHLRHDWDRDYPETPMAEQDVIVTLPASFDQIARELTVKAAYRAGLPRVVLIEEPQAAFYAWMHRHDDWADRVQPGQTVLVCDIGGGTSDFSLIAARETADGRVDFQRRAVGEHLLLGGDNLDVALAAHLEPQFEAAFGTLSPSDYNALVRQCRPLKERLLADDCVDSLTVALPSRGSRLVAATRSLEVDRDTLRTVLLDGFLPRCDLSERPEARQSGFQEFGLPYASDPAITRHLAAFLVRSGERGEPIRPDLLLLNGGFFASPILRERLLDVIADWFDPPELLDCDDLFGAVAFGAACYGRSRRGLSAKIAAGLPRTFYVGVGEQAVCVAPAGLEPGDPVVVEEPQFRLALSRPVEFPIYSSAVRLDDAAGELLTPSDGELTPLPPIRTVLRGRQRAEAATVQLEAGVSELGTLDLGCRDVETGKRWRLQFDVRSTTQTDRVAHTGAGESVGVVDDETLAAASAVIDAFPTSKKPSRLMRDLETAIELPKEQWPPTLLRAMWERAIALPDEPRSRPGWEARWIHLLGYCLRPGYGVALDDWRAGQTYKRLHNKLKHAGSADAVRILWRRIAGGLTPGQQLSLAEPLLTQLADSRLDLPGQSEAEAWRMLASFERLPLPRRVGLADTVLLGLLKSDDATLAAAWCWATARLLARVPEYGPLDCVLPADRTESLVGHVLDYAEAAAAILGEKAVPASLPKPLRSLTAGQLPPRSLVQLAAVQATRLTGDRYRDLPQSMRERAAAVLESLGTDAALVALPRDGGSLPSEQQALALGDSLPPGLTLA